jgi:hypothetical protein
MLVYWVSNYQERGFLKGRRNVWRPTDHTVDWFFESIDVYIPTVLGE